MAAATEQVVAGWATDLRIDAVVAVAVLAAVHLAGHRLTVLDGRFGRRFAQLAEGCLLAYVVVDLLPTVAEAEADLTTDHPLGAVGLAEPAWLACLLGMLLLVMAEAPGRGRGHGGGRDDAPAGVDAAFVLMLVAHSAANLQVGLLLIHHHRDGALAMVAVTSVLAIHLALSERENALSHGTLHRRWGRPTLLVALVAGGVLGAFWQPEGAVLTLSRAVLAGLLILNVFQHHVRQPDVARSPAFLVGALGYGAALTLA